MTATLPNAGTEQVVMLREFPAVSDAKEVHAQILELRKQGITVGASMVLILYSAFDQSSDPYAQAVHAEVGDPMP